MNNQNTQGPNACYMDCHVRDVGSVELTFQTSITADEVQKIMMESDRIFRFQFVSWDGESQRAEIRLIPDKGIDRIQSVRRGETNGP